jgi:hypothetical protein
MKAIRLFAMLALVAVWLGPRAGESCGPFLPEAEFAPVRGPVDPAAYARGDLGVVRPGFRYRDLFVAWRVLSGVPLTPQEGAALSAQPANPPYVSPAAGWMSARNQVPGLPPAKPIDTYRHSSDPRNFYYYPNCLDAAFDTAAAKLQSLVARWGAPSTQVRDWASAQDQVFENCSGGPAIPQPLAAGADPALAADRRYQIAAAEFYAGQFDAAERDFRALTANPAAPYLVARTLIREGTLRNDPAKLRAAADQLNAITAGSGPDRWKQAARSLLGFVQSRIDPQPRLRELSAQLTGPGQSSQIATTFDDFIYLWKRRAPQAPPESDFSDWLLTFSSKNAKHAVERWRDSHAMPWLIAALAITPPAEGAAGDLLAAAHRVPPGEPAWPSATYYGIRMQRLRGDIDAARQWADQALADPQSDSTRNLLRAERQAMARDWTEFLRYSTRRPVAVDYGDGNPDQPFGPNTPAKAVALDTDSVEPMNRMVPLALWSDAASNTWIPAELQADIAQSGWVRALVLEDRDSARAFAMRLAQLRPDLAAGMRAYLAETDPQAAKFAAVFLMLHDPGFSPELRAGLGRLDRITKLDEYRDNWWTLRSPASVVSAPFLSDQDRAEGARQAEQLRSTAANSVNYLCAIAIAWAKAHPNAPRIPEALHLLVRATHFGNSADKSSTPYSKEAFYLLHRRYPDSPWTKQTKYWY